MDVLVQGLFKCFKLLEYEAVTVAGIFWSCIAVGQMLYVAIAFSFNVMFCHHDGYGSFDASTVEFGQGSIFQLSLYHLIDVGKQYQFLFVEMGIEVGEGIMKESLQIVESRMFFTVYATYFIQQFFNLGTLCTDITVVDFENIVHQ